MPVRMHPVLSIALRKVVYFRGKPSKAREAPGYQPGWVMTKAAGQFRQPGNALIRYVVATIQKSMSYLCDGQLGSGHLRRFASLG